MTNLMGCENPDHPTPEEHAKIVEPMVFSSARLEDIIYEKFQVESEDLNAAINKLFEEKNEDLIAI